MRKLIGVLHADECSTLPRVLHVLQAGRTGKNAYGIYHLSNTRALRGSYRGLVFLFPASFVDIFPISAGLVVSCTRLYSSFLAI